ncbi:hypothetical protein ACQKIY_25000 [Bacillus mycoides]|uniref:hypothetical protein n=1 Tax=Bacillus mycoides TaxID=1405 RepID=UPI003CFCA831
MNLLETMDGREILRLGEIKRTAENVSKREFTDVFEVNYNYYMNCIGNRSAPSGILVQKLMEYIQTPTEKMYEMIFAYRSTDRNTNKSVKRDEYGKEVFHKELRMDRGTYLKSIEKLKEMGTLKEPKM